MRRTRRPYPAADFGYRDAARRRRQSRAMPTQAGRRRPAAPTPPGRERRRLRSSRRWQRFRRVGKCTAGRAPDASHIGHSTRTPAALRRPAHPDHSRHAPSSPARERVRTVDLLGDILERSVANVLAVHHVDHVFADILGMIADTLPSAHDPHDFEGPPYAPGILTHELDA